MTLPGFPTGFPATGDFPRSIPEKKIYEAPTGHPTPARDTAMCVTL